MGGLTMSKITGLLGLGGGGVTVVAALSFAQAQPVITVALAGLAVIIPLCVRWLSLIIRVQIGLLQRRLDAQHAETRRLIQAAALAAQRPPQTSPPVMVSPADTETPA